MTKKKEIDFKTLSDEISNLISKFIMPKINFVVFRGVSLGAFSIYGISDLSQLRSLEGKFMYEQGFTSTSMLEETSYFKKDLNDGINYNVEIRYLISSECNDGVLLVSDGSSYSTNQNEYLINKGSLVKVIGVEIDDRTNVAILTVILIPKKIYDLTQDRTRDTSKK